MITTTRAMERAIAVVISTSIMLAVLLLPGLPARAATVTGMVNGMSFVADDTNPSNGATLTGYNNSYGLAVVIPQTVVLGGNSYTVTTIGNNAFNSTFITAVTIPNTVTHIGNVAFGYTNLTQIVIPDSVTTMGIAVFAWSTHLADITLSQSLTEIPPYAFEKVAISSLIIPDSVTAIRRWAFSGANNITHITIPDSVTIIENHVFAPWPWEVLQGH